MKRLTLLLLLAASAYSASYSQVLIALVFGDKLNSPNLEFGMNVGANMSTYNIPERNYYRTDIAVGMYFMWKFHDRFNLQPEFFIRYPGGARKLPTYSVDDVNLNSLLEGADLQRKTVYFSVPVHLKYRIWKQLKLSVGPQVSLLSASNDFFTKKIDNDKSELIYRTESIDKMKRLEFGFAGGLSYKLKAGKGVNLEARYYAGVVDVIKEDNIQSRLNGIFTFCVGIPVGAESDVVVESNQ